MFLQQSTTFTHVHQLDQAARSPRERYGMVASSLLSYPILVARSPGGYECLKFKAHHHHNNIVTGLSAPSSTTSSSAVLGVGMDSCVIASRHPGIFLVQVVSYIGFACAYCGTDNRLFLPPCRRSVHPGWCRC